MSADAERTGPERAGAALRRLIRDDAAEYHAFRLAQLAASPTSFTSTAEEERAKPLSWAADRIAPSGCLHDFILGAFDRAGVLVGITGLSVPEQLQARHKATLFGMAVAAEVRGLNRPGFAGGLNS